VFSESIMLLRIVYVLILIDFIIEIPFLKSNEFKSSTVMVEAKSYWKTKRHDNIENVFLDVNPYFYDFPQNVDIEIFDVIFFNNKCEENTTIQLNFQNLNISSSITNKRSWPLRFNSTGTFNFICTSVKTSDDLSKIEKVDYRKSQISVWRGSFEILFKMIVIYYLFFRGIFKR
jgi:hypothetical protein